MSKVDNKLIPVQDHEDLVKDTVSEAVLNSNVEAYNSFRNKKLKELEVNSRLNDLDTKMTSILEMLEALTNKK